MVLVRKNLPDVHKADLIAQIRAAAGGNPRIATVPLAALPLARPSAFLHQATTALHFMPLRQTGARLATQAAR
jgi:hypothetical protein